MADHKMRLLALLLLASCAEPVVESTTLDEVYQMGLSHTIYFAAAQQGITDICRYWCDNPNVAVVNCYAIGYKLDVQWVAFCTTVPDGGLWVSICAALPNPVMI